MSDIVIGGRKTTPALNKQPTLVETKAPEKPLCVSSAEDTEDVDLLDDLDDIQCPDTEGQTAESGIQRANKKKKRWWQTLIEGAIGVLTAFNPELGVVLSVGYNILTRLLEPGNGGSNASDQ